jgi:hypothetical protein
LNTRLLFRQVWWLSNVLLGVAMVATIFSRAWEFSVRRYLKGFSDAIVPEAFSPQQKVEAILAWMSKGPPRRSAGHTEHLSPRDPEYTLNYQQLMEVCGSSTNAFLNLSVSAGLEARRLLLLTARGHDKTRGRRGVPGRSLGGCRRDLSHTHEGCERKPSDP